MNTNVKLSFSVHLILEVGNTTFLQNTELPISPFPGLELTLWVGNGFETFKIDRVLLSEDVQMGGFGTRAILAQPPVEKHAHLIKGLTKDGGWTKR